MTDMTIGRGALLPCPFCGSEAEVDSYDHNGSTFIQCCNCAARVNGDGSEWNRRAPAVIDAPHDAQAVVQGEVVAWATRTKIGGPVFVDEKLRTVEAFQTINNTKQDRSWQSEFFRYVEPFPLYSAPQPVSYPLSSDDVWTRPVSAPDGWIISELNGGFIHVESPAGKAVNLGYCSEGHRDASELLRELAIALISESPEAP